MILMTTARRATLLLLAVALGLVGCTGDAPAPQDTSTPGATTAAPGDTPSAEPVTPTPPTTPAATPSGTASTPPGDTTDDGADDPPPFVANTEPDTGEATGGSPGTLVDLRVGAHGGFDRVVLELNGPGLPGWNVRYVDEAVGDASGLTVDVEGDAILEVTLFPVAYPEDATGFYDGPDTVSVAGTEVVTEAVFSSLFEGYLQAFVGVDGGQHPFRAYSLTDPARIVVEVRTD